MGWKMRREERAMSLEDIEWLLATARVGRLGTSFRDEPYVVPLHFVYSNGRIYFHSAKEGRKLEQITRNPRVCFEVDEFIGVKQDGKPCSFSTYYRSAIAFGKARVLKAVEEKREALRRLVAKYAKEASTTSYQGDELQAVEVVEVQVEQMTGKQHVP